MSHPTVLATYRLPPGAADAFEDLLREHQQVLLTAALTTEEPATVYRQDTEQGTTFVEVFTWRSDLGVDPHEVPEVADIWQRMIAVCTPRGDQPATDFPHFRRRDL